MKLEELARQSSVAARTSVAQLDVPSIGAPNRPRHLAPLAGAVAVSAVVVGGLLVLGADDVDDADRPVASVPDIVDPPVLALGPDADGWQIDDAADAAARPSGAEVGAAPTFAYYGSGDRTDPFADGDLLVATLPTVDEESTEELGGETIGLRGTTARVVPADGFGLPADATAIGWNEAGTDGTFLQVLVASRTLDVDRLAAIAEAADIDVASGTFTPPPDLGLAPLHQSSLGIFGFPVLADEAGSTISYRDGDDRSLVLTSTAGRLDGVAAGLRWWADESMVTTVTVDGDATPAFVATLLGEGDGSMATRVLVWSPEPGVVATLTSSVPDDSVDILALAASVVELDDAAWDRLIGEASVPKPTDMDVVYAEGSDVLDTLRYGWSLGLSDGSFCVSVMTETGGGDSCQPDESIDVRAGTAWTVTDMGLDDLSVVVILADPVADVAVDETSSWQLYRSDRQGEAGPEAWFVAIGPNDGRAPTFRVVSDGETVAVLEGVSGPAEESEAATEEVPFETDRTVADLPDLIGGLVADPQVVDGGSFGPVRWALATADGEECLATTEPVEQARCLPSAAVAAYPIDVDGASATIVVVHHAADCGAVVVEPIGAEPAQIATDGTTSVLMVSGGADSVVVRLDGPQGSGVVSVGVDEPTADLPPGIGC